MNYGDVPQLSSSDIDQCDAAFAFVGCFYRVGLAVHYSLVVKFTSPVHIVIISSQYFDEAYLTLLNILKQITGLQC